MVQCAIPMRDVLSAEQLARIAAAAKNAVATGDIPGAVCLVWRRGELLQLDAVGLRDIEARLPAERNTIFRIASMSKPVTSVVAVEMGRVGRVATRGSHYEMGT